VSYTVFARKYRPQTFDDVIGQEHITTTLKNAIEQDRLAHAYLFVGPRGTGKTSTARIMAKALNCLKGPSVEPCGACDACVEIAAGTSLDVLEFDAASNTQVDKIREIIIDNVKYAPTRGKYKLYIVDEVHMLSNSSFNALLKTLEEPPAHVKFIFATTDVQKVPTTILSRCQRFDLKRIPALLIKNHLLGIAAKESIALSEAAAETLARGAEGGMRDAESMLDQLVAFCGNTIEEEDVLKIFGFSGRETVNALASALIAGDTPRALGLIHQQAEAGKDLGRLLGDLITHLRNLLVAKADPEGIQADLGEESLAALHDQGQQIDMTKLLGLIEQFAEAEARMKWAPNKKMHLEIAMIRAIQTLGQASLTEVIDALADIREGRPVSKTTTPSPRPPAASAPRPATPAKSVAPAVENAPSPKPTQKAVEQAPVPAPAAPKPEPPTPEAPKPPQPIPVVDAVPPAPEAPEPASPTLTALAPPAAVASAATVASAEPASSPEPATLWRNLLGEVRRQRPLIAMWVESGALLELEGESLTVGFPTDQSLALEYCDQPNNRKLLESIASQLVGRKLKIRFLKREGLVVEKVEVAPAAVEVTRDPLEEFKDDPLIRKALEIFKAEIQPVQTPAGSAR
jgi:DNA polymerase-3 subunit gamma/tau